MLNTEFTWIELRLGEQQLQNDQANQFFLLQFWAIQSNFIQVLGKLEGEQDGSLDIQLSIVEPPEELDVALKMPPFSEKGEEESQKKKDIDDKESFDAFLARQPHNPRPRLIYQVEKVLLEKDDREGTMGRFEFPFVF